MRGWGYVLVIEHACKALGLIPNTTKRNKNSHLSYFCKLTYQWYIF